ncbi:MAG: inositol-3-phosphate synthase, partial [Myxococcales bacterium]|nr:inositol-3-phosphate synthase [Myxococcales bacterium]
MVVQAAPQPRRKQVCGEAGLGLLGDDPAAARRGRDQPDMMAARAEAAAGPAQVSLGLEAIDLGRHPDAERRPREPGAGREPSAAVVDDQAPAIVVVLVPARGVDQARPERGGRNLDLELVVRDLAEQLRQDIRDFKSKNKCDRIVIVWCASTEIFIKPGPKHATIEQFEKAMDK